MYTLLFVVIRYRLRPHLQLLSMLRQLCDSMLIENNGVGRKWLQPHSGVAPLFSMRTVSLASSQSCRSFDANARCDQGLKYTHSSKDLSP